MTSATAASVERGADDCPCFGEGPLLLPNACGARGFASWPLESLLLPVLMLPQLYREVLLVELLHVLLLLVLVLLVLVELLHHQLWPQLRFVLALPVELALSSSSAEPAEGTLPPQLLSRSLSSSSSCLRHHQRLPADTAATWERTRTSRTCRGCRNCGRPDEGGPAAAARANNGDIG